MNNPNASAQSVSVVIRTYNRSDLLRNALDSVLGQSAPPEQILVVDDASTDDTPTVMVSYAERSNRLRYIRLERNVGMDRAMEIGTGAATGELLAFLDSDDLWDPDHLSRTREAFARNPSLAMVFTHYGLIDAEGRTLRNVVKEPDLSERPFEDFLYKRVVVQPTRSVFARRSIEKVGGVPQCKTTGDWVLNVLVSFAHPGGVVQLPSRTVFMRIHPGQSYARPDAVCSDLQDATHYIFDRLPPDQRRLKPRVLAINWLHSAVFYWQSGKYAAAWRCLGKAIRSDLSSVETRAFGTAVSRLFVPPAIGRLLRARKYRSA